MHRFPRTSAGFALMNTVVCLLMLDVVMLSLTGKVPAVTFHLVQTGVWLFLAARVRLTVVCEQNAA